jgi:hypothetical protein
MRRRSARRIVTVRVDAVRRVVLRVLQPRDQSLVLVAELATHQRRLTHHHYILDTAIIIATTAGTFRFK